MSLTAHRRKQLFSLVLWQQLLYLLPDGSRVNRLWLWVLVVFLISFAPHHISLMFVGDVQAAAEPFCFVLCMKHFCVCDVHTKNLK